MKEIPKERLGVYIFLIVLFVLHQDFWLWDNGNLVFGIFPTGLAYHIAYSMLAALAWGLAIQYAWPHEIESEVEMEIEAPEEKPLEETVEVASSQA